MNKSEFIDAIADKQIVSVFGYQCKATYHCSIGKLLTAAYRRDFSMQEKSRCKRKFPAFNEWYATLNANQRQRVDEVLVAEYGK